MVLALSGRQGFGLALIAVGVLLATVVTALLVVVVRRKRALDRGEPQPAMAERLAEIEDLHARGLIDADERRRARDRALGG